MPMHASPLLVNLSVLSSKPTGLSNYALNLSEALCDLGEPVFLSHYKPSFLSDNPRYISIPNGLNTDFGRIGHLKRLLWIQTHLPKLYKNLSSSLLFSPVPEAPIFSNIRYVVTVHDLIPLRFLANNFHPLKVYFKYYVPKVLSQAEHILVDSEATAQDLQAFYQIPQSQLAVVPLAYDTKNFKFLDLPTKDYFVYLGRFDIHKNVKRIVQAFYEGNLYRDYKLYLIGSLKSPHFTALQNYVHHLGLSKHVFFFDYLDYQELPIILNQALALMLPSLWEGFGLPVLEAMACGTPVITSNLSSLPEVADNAAILVDPYNVFEIARAMKEVANSQQLRSDLRDKGLERAKHFSWEKTGKLTMDILKQYM